MTTTDDHVNMSADLQQRLVLPTAADAALGTPLVYPAAKPDYELHESDLAGEASERRDRRRARRRAYRGLARLLRLRPVSRRAMLAALVAEDAHITTSRDPAAASHGEIVVGGLAKAAAERVLARCQRRLHRHAGRADRLRAKRARLLTHAKYTDAGQVRHPDGGHRLVIEIRADAEKQRNEIENETSGGSRKHGRLPSWLAGIPKVVVFVDLSLLTYFFAGITDVDWATPLSASLAFALILALMVTVLCYGFLAFTGHRLRGHKDHTGAIVPGDVDGLSAIAVAASVILIGVVAMLMFIRMQTEVGYALGPGSAQTALAIALAIAVVSAAANMLVVGVHALDGSDQTARLHALSSAASRATARSGRLRRRAAMIPYRLAVRQRRARRLADRAISRAGQRIAAAEQVITAARAIHQSAGPEADPILDPAEQQGAVGYRQAPTGPKPDLRSLRTTLNHVEEDE